MGINKNFVVRNGLEVANTLLYANDETNRVGINSGTPEHALDVIGDAQIDGGLYSPVSTGGTSGVSGQYLQSTGDKWKWESFPVNRQAQRITLTAGQTRVPATGSFGSFLLTEYPLSSIFLDGVKLTEGDYAINSGGGSITLFAAAFGGEEIEVIAHGAAGVGAGSTGILGVSVRKAGIDSGTAGRINIIDFVGLGVTLDGTTGLVTAYIDSGGLTAVINDPTPQLGGYLDLNNNGIAGVGVVTATEFHGDGSNITGISTLNITGYGLGLGGGADGPSGVFGLLNDDSAVGIFTDSAAVGLGTTNPRVQVEIGHVGAAGTQLLVNGDARITGILTVGSSSIAIDGINDEIRIGAGFTLSADTITQTANLQITGIVTATGFDGDLVGQHKVFTAGVSNSDDYDIALFLDPEQGGHTFNRFDLGGKLQYNPSSAQLSNLGVTSTRGLQVNGISTFTDSATFQGNIQLGNNDQAIFGAGNDLRIYFDGANSYIQDQGTGGLNIEANPSVTIGQYGTTEEMASFRVGAGVSLFHNNSKKFETTSDGIDVTGNVETDGLNVSGMTTFTMGYYGSGSEVRFLSDTNPGGSLSISHASGNPYGVYMRFSSHDGNIASIETDSNSNMIIDAGANIHLRVNGDSVLSSTENGSTRLYYSNSQKFGTTPNGTYVTGISSAVSFYGSGIGLTATVDVADGTYGGSTVSPQIEVTDGRITGITATLISGGGGGGGGGGTEVIIEDNDNLVGTAGTINFGSGITVSSSTAGVVTVTAASAEVINDTTPQLGGNLDLNSRTINGTGNINVNGSFRFSGITTFTSDVTIDNGINQTALLTNNSTSKSDPELTLYTNNTSQFRGSRVELLNSSNGTQLVHLNNNPPSEQYFAIEKTDNTGVFQQQMAFYNYADDEWLFKTGPSSVLGLSIDDGRVGVGTDASETYTLTVGGAVTATTYYGDGSNLTGIIAGGGSGTGYFDNNQTNAGIHTTAAHVGLGTTNPRTPLQVEEVYGVYTDYGTFTASSGVTTTGDASWVIATDDFKTAEYTLYFQHSSGIQSQKVLVMNDGSTAYAQEYAIMYNNDLLVSVGASITSGTCELLWTPQTGVSGIVTYRVVRETML